ncbi:MAG: hypothetical protein V1661_00740 [bacterium]
MKQFIIENLLPKSVFVKISPGETDGESSPSLAASLFFEQPEFDNPAMNVREVESMQQYVFDLPDDVFVELNPGHLAGSVNFGVGEDHELLLVRLTSINHGRN